MHIGHYQLFAVEAGHLRLDGGAMFGVVPKTLWQKTNPADETNRIAMVMRPLLLVGEGKKILLDTGAGEKLSAKWQEIYALDYRKDSLAISLAKIGVKPEEISEVIITHLHFDHVGGATCAQGDKAVPAFPNATYYIQRKHWEHGQQPSERDRASFMPENYLPLQEAGQLRLLDGPQTVLPGIEVIPLQGHTPSQQIVKITDGQTTLLYGGDLFPTASHIPLPYIMAYDLAPLLTLEEKRNMLAQIIKENWILFYEHDPYHVATRVVQDGKGYRLGEDLPNAAFSPPLR